MGIRSIISYLSKIIGQLLIKLSINPVNNLLAFTPYILTVSVDLCECGINMLVFCNISLRLTSDTLSHVNNESDGAHIQGTEETC